MRRPPSISQRLTSQVAHGVVPEGGLEPASGIVAEESPVEIQLQEIHKQLDGWKVAFGELLTNTRPLAIGDIRGFEGRFRQWIDSQNPVLLARLGGDGIAERLVRGLGEILRDCVRGGQMEGVGIKAVMDNMEERLEFQRRVDEQTSGDAFKASVLDKVTSECFGRSGKKFFKNLFGIDLDKVIYEDWVINEGGIFGLKRFFINDDRCRDIIAGSDFFDKIEESLKACVEHYVDGRKGVPTEALRGIVSQSPYLAKVVDLNGIDSKTFLKRMRAVVDGETVVTIRNKCEIIEKDVVRTRVQADISGEMVQVMGVNVFLMNSAE